MFLAQALAGRRRPVFLALRLSGVPSSGMQTHFMGEYSMEKTIRILGIAPYEALRAAMVKIAQNRPDLSVDIYLGNMKEGVDIAKFHQNENYDVIISRGATARLIKEEVHIPVISVDFSAYDILRTIKLAENYPYRYAVLGFPGITKGARILCDLLQKDMEIITIYHEEDAKEAIKDLKQRGISMVICGTVGENYAKKMGLASILVLSGDESVEAAFDQAVEMSYGYAYMRERKTLYETILTGEPESLLLYDSNGSLFFSSWNAGHGDEAPVHLPELATMPPEGIERVQTVKNTLFEISGKWVELDEHRYALFRIREAKIPVGAGRQGIFFFNRNQAESDYYNSFYAASGALGMMEGQINALAKTSQPVVITGEEGCGKDQIARYLYIHSPLRNNSFIMIDCELINDKSWAFLINSSGSPFGENNQTYYFKNLDRLAENKYRQLEFVLLEQSLPQRNRVILTCVLEKNRKLPERILRFINQFSCSKIRLPSLRERMTEFSMLASLYMAKKNTELGKQILGFESAALELLQNYDWPCNYTQLKRVLDELVGMSDTSYISQLHTSWLLSEEKNIYGSDSGEDAIDLNRTLYEINRDIINRELVRMKGNQTAVAKKLGISRTTLWRYAKE